MASLDDLAGLINVISGVRGSTQTQRQAGGTTTQTQQTNISDEGIAELLTQILSGPGGIGEIGNSARSAGMYNSTSEDLLYGNLAARAANQAELARSPTVTTTESPDLVTSVETPGIGIGGLAGALGATSALGALTNPDGQLGGLVSGALGNVSSRIGDALGIGSGQAAGTNFLAETATGSGGFMSQIGTGATTGSRAASAAGGSGAAGNFLSSNAAPLGGSFLSGVLGGRDSSQDPTSLALNAAMGFATMGPLGLAAGPISSLLGGVLSNPIQDVGSSVAGVGRSVGREVQRVGRRVGRAAGTVICTALVKTGHLDSRLYVQALRRMHEVSPVTMRGYHFWAIPVAHRIKQGSKFHTALWKPVVVSRTKMLASGATGLETIKYPLGLVSKYLIEPACFVLGKALELSDKVKGESNGYQS